MKVNLFDIDENGAKLTKHVYTIWYLREIVSKYGEQNALKLFKVFDFVYNMNVDENPFANLPEEMKYETALRTAYPELIVDIDMDDIIIEEALQLVGDLYETPKYRKYKALKIAYEKILKEVQFEQVSLRKEDGNTAEYKKAIDFMTEAEEAMARAYSELEKEMTKTVRRGGRESFDRREGGKDVELQ